MQKPRLFNVRLYVIIAFCVAVFSFFPSNAAGFPVHQEFDNTTFDGARIETVAPQPATMPQWTLVARVRPTAASASGSSKTILTNDRTDWNNDVLFGISPEGTSITQAGRWAIIHQNKEDEMRTIAYAENEQIEADRWYHVAASSDGESLRLYVDGQLVAGPVFREKDSLTFRGVDSYIGASTFGDPTTTTITREFEGEIAYVQIYDGALSESEISELAMRAVTPEDGVTASLPDGSASMYFPPDVLPPDVFLSIVIVDEASVPPPAGGFQLLGEVYAFEAVGDDGPVTVFGEMLTLTFQYDPELVALQGLVEADLMIQYYDELSLSWTPLLPSVVDTGLPNVCEQLQESNRRKKQNIPALP